MEVKNPENFVVPAHNCYPFHLHDHLIDKQITYFDSLGKFDVVRAKVPYKNFENEQNEGDADLLLYDSDNGDMLINHVHISFLDSSIKNYLDDCKKTLKYLKMGNGHFPKIKDEISTEEMKGADKAFWGTFGNNGDTEEMSLDDLKIDHQIPLNEEEMLNAGPRYIERKDEYIQEEVDDPSTLIEDIFS